MKRLNLIVDSFIKGASFMIGLLVADMLAWNSAIRKALEVLISLGENAQ